MLAPAVVIILLFGNVASSNEIYINQVGDNSNYTITQDGNNNKVRSLNTTSGTASLRGNNKTFTLEQTGNNNRAGFWTHGGNQVMSLTQDGDSNVSAMDNHGNNNNMTVNIDGDNNVTHLSLIHI